tara:strand:- start:1597 stop:1998 length:402 start_codon:yes stop_codon:yes gene_type:complete
MAIDRTGLNEEEINLIEHCVTLEEQGLIDSDGSVVSGKETEFAFDNLSKCLQTIFAVDEATSTNSINKFKAMSADTKTDKVNQEKLKNIAEAQLYLRRTDWYVVREADSGKAMPDDIKTKRVEARQTINDLEE